MTFEIQNSSFPGEFARTLNYTLGAPKTFRVSSDGKRVFFLRSKSASDRTLDLWCAEVQDNDRAGSEELLIASVNNLERAGRLTDFDPEAERTRKERLREAATGITAYSINDAGNVCAFALGGDVYVTYVASGPRTIFRSTGDATHLALSPNGQYLAFVSKRELFVSRLTEDEILPPIRISPEATENISWGLPEFIASEEMRRYEGYWWSPDGTSIVFAGVDQTSVPIWYVSNPTSPASAPRAIRYPQAGTQNARVSLVLWSSTEGNLREIFWDNENFPYLVAVRWRDAEPTVIVQDRTQRDLVVLNVDRTSGQTSPVHKKHDPQWVELIPGVPSWSALGEIIDAPDIEVRTLNLSGKCISKTKLHVRKFVGELSSGGFVYLASEDPTETHVWLSYLDNTHLKISTRPGVFDADVGGNTIVVHGSDLGLRPRITQVVALSEHGLVSKKISDFSSTVTICPRPQFLTTKTRSINSALLLPQWFKNDRKLPVLVDSYGGPLVQRCIKSANSFTTNQWFANQGFAVLVTDGRGSPGRGKKWEKAIAGNLIQAALEDQIVALEEAERSGAPFDLSKVAIRGWSFGGYLATLAVLLRPDKFCAGIAGAPVTDWRYYDTHYAERYLGVPNTNSNNYESCSAVAVAHRLERPLLLIHGLSDDNVVSAHSFRLSQALFEAGRQHNVLPLTGITHMAVSETAAENLLLAQLMFLRSALSLNSPPN